MKVLLWYDVENLGKRGDIVEVRDGFARNYLFPRNLASPASKGYVKQLNLSLKKLEKIEKEMIKKTQDIASQINNTPITIQVALNPDGRMYGSITPWRIVDALQEKGINISVKQIVLESPIRQPGEFRIPVKLFKDIKAEISLSVVPSEGMTQGKAVEEK